MVCTTIIFLVVRSTTGAQAKLSASAPVVVKLSAKHVWTIGVCVIAVTPTMSTIATDMVGNLKSKLNAFNTPLEAQRATVNLERIDLKG